MGLESEIYYKSTLRELDYKRQAFEYQENDSWKKTRQLEFRILQTYSDKIKSPKDLYLIGDERGQVVELEGNEGAEFLKNMFPKKQ